MRPLHKLTCRLFQVSIFTILPSTPGARGDVVVKALATNRQVAGSIPDGVIGIFQ
jgi:hypothetical protein